MVNVLSVGLFIFGSLILIQGFACLFRPKQYLDWAFGHSTLFGEIGPVKLRLTQAVGLVEILVSPLIFLFAAVVGG